MVMQQDNMNPARNPLMTVSWLEELNPTQREAVTHDDGPLLIVAGVGTGKTRTLACPWPIRSDEAT